MEALHHLVLIVENDMRGCVLDFMLAALTYPHTKLTDVKSLAVMIEILPYHIEDLLGIHHAWHGFLADTGIDPNLMDKAYSTQRHGLIDWFIRMGSHFDLEPDEEVVDAFKAIYKDYYEGGA
jgi:hypothetical protein